ncbi:DUF2062 domain-containing protein [bacterium]|nr:DUF2062 domain-containing protein [bacterium]
MADRPDTRRKSTGYRDWGFWGWQTLFAIYLAQRLHLNKVLTLVGANISIPPMIPGIIYLSMVLGRFALSNEWRWQLPLSGLTMEAARMYLKEFVIGSSILAIIAGILIGILSYGMFHYVEKKANSA